MPIQNTPRSPDAQAIRQHFVWQETIAAAGDLSPTLRLVALRLAMHRNGKTGRCFISYTTLAAEVAIAPRSAMRGVAELERRGWLAVDRGGGRGHANEFRFLTPAETVTGESQFSARNSDTWRSKTVTPEATNSDSPRQETVTELCHPNTKYNIGAATQPPIWKGRESALARDDALDRGGSRLTALATDEDSETEHAPEIEAVAKLGEEMKKSGKAKGGDHGGKRKIDGTRTVQSNPAPSARELGISKRQAGYAELRAIWDRQWPQDACASYEDDARRAYAVACREADPGDIAEAARAWVATYAAADGVRFLPKLAKWLDGRCWLNAPLPKRARQISHGGRRGKADLSEIAKQWGEYADSGMAAAGGLQ